MIKKQTLPETNRCSDSLGVREKSLSFCRKTDLWMTPENLCFPLLSYSEILAELCVLSDLPGSCSLGQGRGALGWWVCCFLLRGKQASGRFSRGHFLITLLLFDGLKKYNPQTKTTPFHYHTFHSAFSWYIYQGNRIFFSFCF